MNSDKRGTKKTQSGTVFKDKMDKTVVVIVDNIVKHPLYGKYIRKRNKYKAHDEKNICKNGDKVIIMESRPYSKEKRWRVVKVLEKAV